MAFYIPTYSLTAGAVSKLNADFHACLYYMLCSVHIISQSINHSINPLACTECGDSLPFSGASSIPPCHTLFPATPLRRPFFHPPSLHPAIYFLVYLLVLLFPDSCTILFWESYFLPFSAHVQTLLIITGENGGVR